MKNLLPALIGIILLSCGEKSTTNTPYEPAEKIEFEEGKLYHLKFGDSEYEFHVGDKNFSVMRLDGIQDERLSPFTVILENGQLWYEIRSTDGTNVFAVQDFDGDGLGDRRMTFPIVRLPGSKAKMENITHQFTPETDSSVRKLSSERKSEQADGGKRDK